MGLLNHCRLKKLEIKPKVQRSKTKQELTGNWEHKLPVTLVKHAPQRNAV